MNIEILPVQETSHSSEKSILTLPLDKSIFHRILIIGSLTESKITIPIHTPIAEDVQSTINALGQLGVKIEIHATSITIWGIGLYGFQKPSLPIDCGNSGTTVRLLMGILAAQPFSSTLIGDTSLSQRPMKRLAEILNNDLGADIQTSENGGMPVVINGKKLKGANTALAVSSAQMKSAVLLAGLYTDKNVTVTEPSPSRDHTERMLEAFGSSLQGIPSECIYEIPGDISAAAFLIVAAIMLKKRIILKSLGLNPTRIRYLDILSECGLRYIITNRRTGFGEERGDVEIDGMSDVDISRHQFTLEDIPLVIDEIPILAVLAAFSNGTATIRHAEELRKKEGDRITLITENLRSFGANIEEHNDGFTIVGNYKWRPSGGIVNHGGDHRIAMAFAVMALRASDTVTIPDANVVSISFPTFSVVLAQLAGRERVT